MRAGLLMVLGLAAAAGMAWFFLTDAGPTALDDVGIDDVGIDDDTGSGIQGVDEGTNGTRKGIQGRPENGNGSNLIRSTASPAEGVSGRVVAADGIPVKGATVHLFERRTSVGRNPGRPDGKVLAQTATGDDGTFVVGPGPEDMPLRVRAQAPGYAPVIADVALRGSYVEIVLDRGGSLRVRIVDRAGEPVVNAQAVHMADEVVTRISADEQGMALFPALTAGSASLVITARGYRSLRDAQLSIVTGEETERTVVLVAARVVEGTVVDGDTAKPITDAQVSANYPTLPALAPEPPVTTDDEGRFRLSSHAGERERIQYRVKKAGYAEARSVRSANDTGKVQITLYRQLDAFRGVVYDTNRIPAAGVRVTYGRLGGLSPDEKPPETRTNEMGNFKLPAVPWATRGTGYQIVALSDSGEIGQRYVSVPTKPEAVTKRLEIFLVGSGQLNGKVFSSDGAGVGGAVVTVEPDWSQRANAGQSWQVFQTARDRRLLSFDTVTDEGGSYLFMRLPAMQLRVNAKYGGQTGTARETVTILPGEMSQMDITIGAGGAIQGWVHDDRNEPVAGAQVRAIPVGQRPGRQPSLATRSRSDGTFELRGVGEGTYQISASLVGYGSAVAKDIRSGQTGVALVLPERGRIAGVVIEGGRPFSGTFTAEARPTGGTAGMTPMGDGRGFGGGARRQFNSDAGKFELSGLPVGKYTVHVSTPEGLVGASGSVAVAEGGEPARVRIELGDGAVLRGRVVDHSGTPMSGAHVQVWPRRAATNNSAATTGRAKTNQEGRYEVKGLGPGAYNVTVWATGRNWSVDVELADGATRDLDLVYQRPGMVEIVVVDQDERAISGAQPDLVSAGGVRVHANYQASKRDGLIQDPQDWARMQRTDANGRIERHHVPPGRYKVSARHRDYLGTSKEVWVEVQTGGRSQARVMLRRKKDDDR